MHFVHGLGHRMAAGKTRRRSMTCVGTRAHGLPQHCVAVPRKVFSQDVYKMTWDNVRRHAQ